jgi:hypothetical protein
LASSPWNAPPGPLSAHLGSFRKARGFIRRSFLGVPRLAQRLGSALGFAIPCRQGIEQGIFLNRADFSTSVGPITKRFQSFAVKLPHTSGREFAVEEQGISTLFEPVLAHSIDEELNYLFKVIIESFMTRYKRNQIEEAIVRTLGAKDAHVADLKLKMKRLLVTDRRLGRRKRSKDEARYRYAFYSQRPQGSGVEVMFSGYEAFALLAALIVLEHGIPQAKVVSILREIRPDFEAAYRDRLQKDPKALFDPQSIQATARPGMFAVDNTAPVFLAFVKLDIRQRRVHAFIAVCRGHDELGEFIKEQSVPGSGATHFEFTRLMHTLAGNLSQTRPIKRGRSTT